MTSPQESKCCEAVHAALPPDGACACPCHSTAPTEEWEKEFDTRAFGSTDEKGDFHLYPEWKIMKEFVRTLLHKAREEGRLQGIKQVADFVAKNHPSIPSPPQE
jgi:hypothetical protein